MRIRHLALSIMILAVISPNLSWGHSLGQSRGKKIKVEKAWEGEIKAELRKEAPQNGFIVNEKAWAKLWEAYRGNKLLLPKIDFDKQMTVVEVNCDFNHNSSDSYTLRLNNKGDLEISVISTLIGGENLVTCEYVFFLISREGVKSISGIPVPKG